jgi:predicted phosphodiesterase
LVDSHEGTVLGRRNVHTELVGDVKISGPNVITCSDDRSIAVLSRTSLQRILHLTPHPTLAINNLAFDDGTMFASTDDGAVWKFALPDFEERGRLDLHEGPIRALEMLGVVHCATGDRSGLVRLWRTSSNRWTEVGELRTSARIVAIHPLDDDEAVVTTEHEVLQTRLPRPRGRRRVAEIARRSGTVLHLSDIHCDSDLGHVEAAVSALLEDLRRELDVSEVRCLVISGDLTQTAARKEFDAAAEFVRQLRRALKIRDVIVTPGNHDVDWAAKRRGYGDPPSGPVPKAPSRSPGQMGLRHGWQRFTKWHEAIVGTTYPLDPRDQFVLLPLNDLGVTFLGLNSAWFTDHRHPNQSELNEIAVARALTQIPAHGKATKQRLLIGVWHHPIAGTVDEAPLRNPALLDQLAKAGFAFVLHGHVHRPEVNRRPFDLTGKRGLVALGVGTFGAPVRDWYPGFPLGYQLLNIDDMSVSLTTRKREFVDGPWLPDARWRLAPDVDPVSTVVFPRLSPSAYGGS